MTAAAPPFDAAALVRTLSDEAKDALLTELIRELSRLDTESGSVPFLAPDGKFLGSYLSPAAARAQFRALGLGQLEGQALVDAVLACPDAVFDFHELNEELYRADMAGTRQPPPAAPVAEAARSDGPA